MGKLAVLVFVIFCVGVAGGVYYVAVHQPNQTVQEAEQIEGTIVSTDIEVQSSTDTSSGGDFAPVVTYEYTVDGETYTSDRYSLVGGGLPTGVTRAEAGEHLEPYSAGQPIQVHVVPDDPTVSFVERGSTGGWIYALVGFFGLVGALGVFAIVDDLLGLGYANIK